MVQVLIMIPCSINIFGAGIKQGETYEKTVIPDIAPTISSLLGIIFQTWQLEGRFRKY